VQRAEVHAVDRGAVDAEPAGAHLVGAQVGVQRDRVARAAALGVGGDDDDVAERRDGLGERVEMPGARIASSLVTRIRGRDTRAV
jgi:hypothetical protein